VNDVVAKVKRFWGVRSAAMAGVLFRLCGLEITAQLGYVVKNGSGLVVSKDDTWPLFRRAVAKASIGDNFNLLA
jgi:hypothetical protein